MRLRPNALLDMTLQERIEHGSGPRRPGAPLEPAARLAVPCLDFGSNMVPTIEQIRIFRQTWSFGHRLFPGETLEQSESS
jgi:hypothetical protein